MENYKFEAIEQIIFTLQFEVVPQDIVRDVERILGVKKCVLYLEAYLDDSYRMVIYSTNAVEKLRSDNILRIGRHTCEYKLCDSKIWRVKILDPPPYVRLNQIDESVCRFGTVLYSELLKRANNNFYFAVMENINTFPTEIGLRRKMCRVERL